MWIQPRKVWHQILKHCIYHRKFTNAIVMGQKFNFQILYLHLLKIQIWVENWKVNRGTILTLHLMPLQIILELFLVMWAMSFHTVRVGQTHLNLLYAYFCKVLWSLVSVSFRWWVNSSELPLYELFLLNIFFNYKKQNIFICRSLQKKFCIPLTRIMYFYADRYFYIPYESL